MINRRLHTCLPAGPPAGRAGRDLKKQITQIILGVTCCLLLAALIGCEAFVRKFTRKPKKENLPKEEIVLVPEEYKGSRMSKEDLYRKYFLFWKSWQDELINYLAKGANHKKQVDCAEQAMKNLINLRALLSEDKQKKLDDYLTQLQELKSLITQDLYGNNITTHRQKAERLKRQILKDFSYPQIKNYLI